MTSPPASLTIAPDTLSSAAARVLIARLDAELTHSGRSPAM